MHKCVMHFLRYNCLNNHIHVHVYYISLKILSVIKPHVFTSRDPRLHMTLAVGGTLNTNTTTTTTTSRDENSVGPDQLGSWLIGSYSVIMKKDKTRLSMKVVNIHHVMYNCSRFTRIIVKKINNQSR